MGEIEIMFNGEQFVRKLIEISGKDQKEIAREFNVGESTISKLKKQGFPTSKFLYEFAEKYNCSIDYLLGLSDIDKEKKPLSLDNIVKQLLSYDALKNDKRISLDAKLKHEGDGRMLGQGVITISDYYYLFNKYIDSKPAFQYLESSYIPMLINKIFEDTNELPR